MVPSVWREGIAGNPSRPGSATRGLDPDPGGSAGGRVAVGRP